MKSTTIYFFLTALLPLISALSLSSTSQLQQQQRWRRRHHVHVSNLYPSPYSSSPSPSSVLFAEKNDRMKSSGEGFGKSSSSSSNTRAPLRSVDTSTSTQQQQQLPDLSPSSPPSANANNNNNIDNLIDDPNLLSPEERSQTILRQKFGLKSYEEQQADLGDYRALLNAEQKKERRNKLRNLDQVWPEDKDFLAVLPPSLIKGIDTFLKIGLGISTVAFIAAGIFITIEAGSKATGSPLPEGLETFVVNVVEPNFTPGLGVLLAFSVTLGLFSVALGGSASSTYREDR